MGDAITTRSPEFFEVAAEVGLVPVVVVDRIEEAEILAPALVEAGLPIAEVTLRTPVAIEAIRVMSEVPGLFVGAGTVIDPVQLDAATAAGARFIVSPGTSSRVVHAATAAGIPIVPGATTPTEIQQALELGLGTVKFFPAAMSGGPPAIAALSAPFPQVAFMPTGGVTLDSLGQYLRLPCVTAVGGSWMVPRSHLVAARRSDLVALIREAVQAASAARAS